LIGHPLEKLFLDPPKDELNGDTEAMETCLIFGCIVRGRKMNLVYISELILGGSNEQYTYPNTFNVEGTIEVHLLMLRAISQDRLLDLGPFVNEINQNLRLDGQSAPKLNGVCAIASEPKDTKSWTCSGPR